MEYFSQLNIIHSYKAYMFIVYQLSVLYNIDHIEHLLLAILYDIDKLNNYNRNATISRITRSISVD